MPNEDSALAGDIQADLKDLQGLCKLGAQDLTVRLFKDSQGLEWKPGTLSIASQSIKKYTSEGYRQIRRLHKEVSSNKPKEVFGEAWASPTGAPGASKTPVSNTGRGEQLPKRNAIEDLYAATRRSGLSGEGMSALSQAPTVGYDFATMDYSSVAGSGTPGYQAAPPPGYTEAIEGFSSMLAVSGLLEGAAVNAGTDIALDVAGAIPLVGAAMNLSMGAIQNAKGAQEAFNATKLALEKKHLTHGSPRHAIDGMIQMYGERSAEYFLRGELNVAAGAIGVAAAAGDYGLTGTVASVAKIGADLAITLGRLAMDFLQFRLGNHFLHKRPAIADIFNNSWATGDAPVGGLWQKSQTYRNSNHVSRSIFHKCPLLGTYIITEAEDAVLLAMMTEGDLGDDWMEQVLNSKPRLDKLRRKANSLQRDAPFRLKGNWKGRKYLDMRNRKFVERWAHNSTVAARDPEKAKLFIRDMSHRVRGMHPSHIVSLNI